jgi:hypothetical protein
VAGSYVDPKNVNHGFVRSVDGNFTIFDPQNKPKYLVWANWAKVSDMEHFLHQHYFRYGRRKAYCGRTPSAGQISAGYITAPPLITVSSLRMSLMFVVGSPLTFYTLFIPCG